MYCGPISVYVRTVTTEELLHYSVSQNLRVLGKTTYCVPVRSSNFTRKIMTFIIIINHRHSAVRLGDFLARDLPLSVRDSQPEPYFISLIMVVFAANS